MPGTGERHSTRDKGHEEGGSAYAKAGSSILFFFLKLFILFSSNRTEFKKPNLSSMPKRKRDHLSLNRLQVLVLIPSPEQPHSLSAVSSGIYLHISNAVS